MVIVKDKNKIQTLRQLREQICFPIINRGPIWYNSLTATQRTELKNWYEQWLNVTETLVMPVSPSWLKNKVNLEETVW